MRSRVLLLTSLLAGSAAAFDCPAHLAARPYTVAVFYADGVAGGSFSGVGHAFGDAPGATLKAMDAKSLAEGGLEGVSVVVVPGGSATKQRTAMGPKGVEALKAFVAKGGGYVGLCAGAYLAGVEPAEYGLGLLPLRVVDRENWRRGSGAVGLEPAPAFAGLPWPNGWLYRNGPLLEIVPSTGLPEPTPVARFSSDINAGTPFAGRMPGTLAVVRGHYGRGRVVVFSPHPELTPGGKDLLVLAARWAAVPSIGENKP